MLFGSATSRFTIDITSLELLYPNQTLLVFFPAAAPALLAPPRLDLLCRPPTARLRRGPHRDSGHPEATLSLLPAEQNSPLVCPSSLSAGSICESRRRRRTVRVRFCGSRRRCAPLSKPRIPRSATAGYACPPSTAPRPSAAAHFQDGNSGAPRGCGGSGHRRAYVRGAMVRAAATSLEMICVGGLGPGGPVTPYGSSISGTAARRD